MNGREPAPAIEVPEAPEYLDERGKMEWFKITHELFSARMISSMDRAMLGNYCSAVSRLEAAEIAVRKYEAEVTDQSIDEKARGRAVYLLNMNSGKRNRSAAEVHRLGVEFGLSPAARSKMRLDDNQIPLPFFQNNQPSGDSPLARAQRLASGE